MILFEKEWSDSAMFYIALQDVPQIVADNVIRSVQIMFSYDNVIPSYQGNIEKGDVELTIPKGQGSRHDITKLCACICKVLGTSRIEGLDITNDPTYIIFDGAFSYDVFDCIVRRFRMIENARKNHANTVICATCGNCCLPRLGIDRCNMWSKFDVDISTSLNRELAEIDLGDLRDGIRFSSPKTMTCEFSNLNNFMHMLTIEQLIDVYKLI